ncbi:calpastatin isoform X9 [Misgurnus anguillicaudatus]|uniref:calpastatin isoform X9 n=1 Tax=Misgurnus anguillicaudatus TaxID=75329 RepID=UPI003CCF9E76
MGQLISWIRGTQDQPPLRDVAVEEQVFLIGYNHIESQKATPTSASQVSAAKPAQYEKGSTHAAVKPGTTPPSGAGGGAAGTHTSQKGSPQVTQQATKPAPPASAKVPSVSSGTGPAGTTFGAGAKPTDPAKDKAQSTTIHSSKPGPVKVDASVGKPVASAGLPGSGLKEKSGQKVQVEVGPSAPKVSAEIDPFDALSDTLPSTQPEAPKPPKYTGPEVKETNINPEKGVLCGERESTLPPGYRREDWEKKTPAGVPEKPKEVPKPISTDEALEALSTGFVSSAPSAPKKTELVTETVGAKSAGFSNFAPPPPSQQKQQTTTFPSNMNKSPAPPADKKAKIERPGENLTASKSSTTAQHAKPKTDVPDSSIPTDALSELGDMLGEPEPPKKQPELNPKDIIDENKIKSEKGIRVGEREDSLPPAYRFSEEDLKKHPPPPKEPSIGTDDALDILSGDFTTPAAAPVVKAGVPPKAPAQEKKTAGAPGKAKDVPKVDELSALDALAGDFVAPPQAAHKVSSSIPPGPKQSNLTDEDPFSALGDTLSAPEPPKKQPELKPGDFVKEKELTSVKGVRVGERDDTLPPGYRFSEEELKKYPAPPREPSLGTDDALDLLSGDFESTPAPTVAAPPVAKLPVCTAVKPPPKPLNDFDLEVLADDFVAPTSASKVQSAVPVPPHPERQMSDTSSALDALSDTLEEIKPRPEPTPISQKAIVKEIDIVEERVSKPGETDDSLPPDHRFSEADKKAFEEAKKKCPEPKQASIDDAAALDLLDSDFSSAPTVKASAPEAHTFTPERTPPTYTAQGAALDELADKLIPNLEKPKESKAKAQGAALDELADKLIPNLEKAKDSKAKAQGAALDELADKLIPNLEKPKESKAKGKGGKSKSKQKKQSGGDSSAVENLSSKPSSKDVVPSAKDGKR